MPRTIRKIAKQVIETSPFLRRHILASSDYRVLSGREEAKQLMMSSTGWLTSGTVARHEHAYRRLIAEMKRGRPRIDLEVAARAIVATGIQYPRIVEIGCGTGSYAEVFAKLLPDPIEYRGLDYSEAMIARARMYKADVTFDVGDATKLPYPARSFDIVFNGVSLMHIVDYEAAVHEAARVAKFYCILHGVPVFHDCTTTFLTKYAYGAPVVEVIFEKRELLSLCKGAGLQLESEWSGIRYDVHELTGYHSHSETYLFSVNRV